LCVLRQPTSQAGGEQDGLHFVSPSLRTFA
jgi:hypothetical protein